MHLKPIQIVYILSCVVLIIIGVLGYGTYKYKLLAEAQKQLTETFLSGQKISDTRFAALEEKLGVTADQNQVLSDSLKEQSDKNQALQDKLEGKLENIDDTVDDLQKLAKTDPQLLAKYSKVFFLSENYAPARLTIIDKQYLYSEDRVERFDAQTWPYLKRLFGAAAEDKITLYVKSGYRSFEEQRNTKSAYTVSYGAGTANTFSADQGYSEHQLGTTLDFITTGLGGQLDGFDNTPAYTWLLNNAHKYGFVISYPKGNQYYIFEPWHWRFVGVKLATYLHRNNKYFYDLDQRDIDKYLVNLFD